MTAFCQRIVSAHWFHAAILFVILVAAALVGSETYPQINQRQGAWLRGLDLLIVAIFTAEIALRLGAQGRRPWRFFRDPWNVFDFTIVAACLLPFDGHYVAVLRLARVLRALRLVTALPRLRLLVNALLKSLPAMGYVGLLLFLLFYVYAVLGTFLFGTNDPAHFGSLQASLLTLFQTITLDNWGDILKLQLPVMPAAAAIYFVSFILVGTMIMLNLFIGVIMNGMHETQREHELAEIRQRPDLAGVSTLGDEIKIIEHELDKLKEQMRALRLQASRIPARANGACCDPLETAF